MSNLQDNFESRTIDSSAINHTILNRFRSIRKQTEEI